MKKQIDPLNNPLREEQEKRKIDTISKQRPVTAQEARLQVARIKVSGRPKKKNDVRP